MKIDHGNAGIFEGHTNRVLKGVSVCRRVSGTAHFKSNWDQMASGTIDWGAEGRDDVSGHDMTIMQITGSLVCVVVGR